MNYIWSSIVAIILALGAWIFKLVSDNKSLKQYAANQAAQSKIQEWQDKISTIESKVTEDERNYEEARKQFNTNNPDKPSS